MKLTFKVRPFQPFPPSRHPTRHERADSSFFVVVQDLKQEKFVIEVEPSETVCSNLSFRCSCNVLARRHLVRG